MKLVESELCVGELVKTVPMLVLRATMDSDKNFGLNLRCLLFSRVILSGKGSSEESFDASIFNKETVIKTATMTSKQDSAIVFKQANPTRWQTKAMAAHLACCCFSEILKAAGSEQSERLKSRHFNVALATSFCEEECKHAREQNGVLPQSILAFHLQELVTSSCMASVASLDQSELVSVQESSLHYLMLVIEAFSLIPDPDMPGSDLLHQYSQQVYSVVKHALSSTNEVQTEGAFRVFVVGCETVSAIFKERMATEAPVLKRLVRPIVPQPDEISFGTVLEKSSEPPFAGVGYSNMIKRAKIAYSGDLLFGGVPEEKELLKGIAADLVKDRAAFGAECGMLALEGAKLLRSQNFSLAGVKDHSADDGEIVFSCGEYHADATAMQFAASSWASCARGALTALSWAVGESEEGIEREERCKWMNAIGKLVLSGCEDSIKCLSEKYCPESSAIFAIDAERVAIESLCGLGILIQNSESHVIDLIAVGNSAKMLQQSVVEPMLTTSDAKWSDGVVKQICQLYHDFSALLLSLKDTDDDCKGMLFSYVLRPLDLIQQGKLGSNRVSLVANIINASQNGAVLLVKNGLVPESLVKSLVEFIAGTILQTKDEFSLGLHTSAKALLLECVVQPSVPVSEKKRVALQMAQAGQWDVWAVVYKSNEGDSDDRESLGVLRQSLASAVGADAHLAAFAAVSHVVNGTSAERLALIVVGVGSEIMGLLHYYGTLASAMAQKEEAAKRQICFAESIKVALLFYQQLLAEDFLAQFLFTVFQSLLAVLRFNGLPHHPSGQEKGDATLGRLVAQTVLHVARTSPDAFKGCMASVSDQDRALLEFAVRGEMTGYAQSQGQAPAKKKLNLKSFKK